MPAPVSMAILGLPITAPSLLFLVGGYTWPYRHCIYQSGLAYLYVPYRLRG